LAQGERLELNKIPEQAKVNGRVIEYEVKSLIAQANEPGCEGETLTGCGGAFATARQGQER